MVIMMDQMVEKEPEVRPRGSLEFVETSILDTIVPLVTELDIEGALKGSVERLDQRDSPLASIPQRQALFFDETINVYVVLQTPYLDETILRSYLSRLIIALEAEVVNEQADPHEGPPGKEIIYNASVQGAEDPFIVVQGSNEDAGPDLGDGHILILWKLNASLVRPRLRLSNPSIIFSATAKLKAPEPVERETTKAEYLPSQTPSGLNLLESFSDDPALRGIKPRLSALRISRVSPATQATRNLMKALKNISSRTIRIYPAINARVRYTKPRTVSSTLSMIASLEVEFTPFTNCELSLDKVTIDMKGGEILDLNNVSGMEFPIRCLPQDDITFVYRLQPDELDPTNDSPTRILTFALSATAKLAPSCHSKIIMEWTTSVDFVPPKNPYFPHPTRPTTRTHKTTQLSIDSTSTSTSTIDFPTYTNSDTHPSNEATTRHQRSLSAVPNFGITMTFTGSLLPIHLGTPFTWTVFIVNRSDRPRKLALIPLPKRRRTEARITRPPSTGHGAIRKDSKIADAVIDENILHAMQKSSVMETTEIVFLNPDIRVGPLAPGACHEVELRFLALKTGVLDVEAVRVVDLGNQEHVDIKELPVIIVSPVEGARAGGTGLERAEKVTRSESD